MTYAHIFCGISAPAGNTARQRLPRPLPAAQSNTCGPSALCDLAGRLELAEAAQGVPFAPKNDIPDALAAYRHFLTGRGAARTFSYERYVANDASGRTTLRSAILEAMSVAYDLHRAGAAADGGSFSFTGSAIGCGGTTGGFSTPRRRTGKRRSALIRSGSAAMSW